MKKINSAKHFKQARKLLVGGVNSPVRSFKSVGGSPIVIRKGLGSKLYDYDNNTYTDYCLSWGALILGHGNRNVSLSSKKTIEKGISFGTTTVEEINIAKHIINCIPSIQAIRFVNSGTEAAMSAIRLARGFTNKEIVVKFDGCYHGHFDDFLTNAGSGVAQLKASSSQGVPESHIKNTLSLPYNNIEALQKTLLKHKDDIASVIIEPVAGNMGVIPASIEFLKVLRGLTKKYNIVLIFDEIMTGFRAGQGSVQSELNIIPDLTCLGKIIGGGFPIGAYGGKKRIMNCLAPKGGVYQAGTFSGNPVIMKAGHEALRLLNKEFYGCLNEKSEKFSLRMNSFFEKNGIDAHFSHYKSMMSIRFRKKSVQNYNDALDARGGKYYGELFRYLLDKGIYWPPAELETFFISGAHSQKDLNFLSEVIQGYFIKKYRR
ncbi:MAG: glutamate-1-semialdehyde 2,1-aminomutase [Candidatus Omnitrophota bacterium]